MKIENGIREHQNPRRKIVSVRWTVVHRLSLATETQANPHPVEDDILCGRHIYKAFDSKAMGTGGLVPYHFLLRSDNVLEQLLPLSAIAQHAAGYNGQSVGFAIAGNYDIHHMPQWMHDSAVEALSTIALLSKRMLIMGHCPELTISQKDPDKRCPGKFVDMSMLRHNVELAKPDGWRGWTDEERLQFIEAKGLVI